MKRIKPKLNNEGEQIIGFLTNGDYYFTGDSCDPYHVWKGEFTKDNKVPIYYLDKFPNDNEKFYYFDVMSKQSWPVYYRSNCDGHNKLIELGNCFETAEEAINIDNITKILENIKNDIINELKKK